MTLSRGRRLLARTDTGLITAGSVALASVLALLLPWLRANPPAGLTGSNSPYTDEGFFSSASRSMVLFGSFGQHGLYRQFTDGSYTLATATVFSITGPSIAAARLLSVVSVGAMVVLAVWGLNRLIGFAGAVIVAAGLGGSQLLLLYGHFALVEPFETALLMAAFTAMARGMESGRWWQGALCGVLLTAAAGAKLSALLVYPAVLGVPVVAVVATRAWRRLLVPVVAVGTALVLTGIWVLTVVLPNRREFDAGFKTLSVSVSKQFPHSIGGVFSRLRQWLSHPALTDHAVSRTLPLLVAATVGSVLCAALWRRVSSAHLWITACGLVWAAASWAVPVVEGYSPNRYLVVAIPGLALAAGTGLGAGVDWVASWVHRPAWGAAGAVALALLVAVPGAVSYLRMERSVTGTHQLASDEAAVEGVLPRNAVLFGLYAPEMAFSAPVHTVVPWPQSGLHMQDPVQRYGVNYVIADISKAGDWGDAAILRAVSVPGRSLGRPLVTVVWGPHTLAVYRVGTAPPTPK